MAGRQVVGTWKLVSNEYRYADGSVVTPFGDDPDGLLIYSEEGYMSVQVARRDRKPFAINDVIGGAFQEVREAFVGYMAYFGTYELDEATTTITHSVLGSLMPNWIGESFRRIYTLTGNRLTLKSVSSHIYNGIPTVGALTWERA